MSTILMVSCARAIPPDYLVLPLGVQSGSTSLSIVEDPAFSPAPGFYSSAQGVVITSATLGATICYDGTGADPECDASQTGCATGTLHSGAAGVSSSSTLKAVACKPGFVDSSVASGAYTIASPNAAAPSFSPPAGTYGSTQNVSISTTSSPTIICYSTGGTPACDAPKTGCGVGTLYSGAVSIPTTATLEALACGPLFVDSSVTSGGYTISAGLADPPLFSPIGGLFNTTQNVVMSTSTGGVPIICYTTTGATPACNGSKDACTTGNLYSGAVAVSTTATVQALACAPTYTDSTVTSYVYTIDSTVPTTPAGFGGLRLLTTIDLNWTASTDNLTATGNIVYEICVSTSSTGCNTFTATITTAPGATSYTGNSFSLLTTYYIRIRARDQAGNKSVPSAQQTFTPVLS